MGKPDVLTVAPREVNGRDTIARLNIQFQAAAFASLAILKGDVDRVYCDWHDDFVIRKPSESGPVYHFYQVKTKRKLNEQWSVLEIFALKKAKRNTKHDDDPEALKTIENSFAGKLFVHSITFDSACAGITFISNIHCRDDLIELVADLSSGKIESPHGRFLLQNFTRIFAEASSYDEDKVRRTLRKLSLEPAAKHLGFDGKDFVASARGAIHDYSEIDLTQKEVSKIASSLLELVHSKSHRTVSLSSMDPVQLDAAVGISLEDLLGVLSISPDAYEIIRKGGDTSALKSASIIQRVLEEAGASDGVIEYLSQRKADWDVWVRTRARHDIPPYEFEIIGEMITNAHRAWSRGTYSLQESRKHVSALRATPEFNKHAVLTEELVLGGLMAVLVKQRSL